MAQHKPIRSRWADFMTAYKKGDILVNLGNNVLRTPGRLKGWKKDALDAYLCVGKGELNAVPRYVFASNVSDIIKSKQTMETINLLKEFGKYRLPASLCCAEFESDVGGIRYFTFCYEKTKPLYFNIVDSKLPFVTCMFALHDYSHPDLQNRIKRKGGTTRLTANHFAVIYPIMSDMENVSDGVFDDVPDDQPELREAGGVAYATGPAPWLHLFKDENIPEAPIDEVKITREYVVNSGFAIRALTSMLQTKGIAREIITAEDVHKLNKKRSLCADKALIPPHTYVRIGHYYKKDGTRVNVDPKATGIRQRFHMRCAHTKMQAYGPGGNLRKRILIDAYLVNANADEDLVVSTRLVRT